MTENLKSLLEKASSLGVIVFFKKQPFEVFPTLPGITHVVLNINERSDWEHQLLTGIKTQENYNENLKFLNECEKYYKTLKPNDNSQNPWNP